MFLGCVKEGLDIVKIARDRYDGKIEVKKIVEA